MKTSHLSLPPLFLSALLFTVLTPFVALAHESHVYNIGGVNYRFVVGSLDEPITVDDRTGVDFKLRLEPSGDPVEGIDQTLKVEIIAADKKKTFDLSPVHGTPGEYKAVYYPTLPTTLQYRFFGEINDTPVDLTFTCNPVGHPRKEENTEKVVMSEGVTRTLEVGAFGCPAEKADLGFPEQSASIYEIQTQMGALDTAAMETRDKAAKSKTSGMIGIVFGFLGFLAGVGAWMKKSKSI